MGGLLSQLSSMLFSKEMELVIIGLENSGKSTLVAQLSQGEPLEQGPTIGLDIKTFKKNNVKMKCWDLGGQGTLFETSLTFLSTIQSRMG